MMAIGLALTLGVIAGLIAYTYLSGVQNRAYADARLANVYVARSTIPRGMSGAAAFASGLIEKTEIPVKFRPSEAIDDPRAIASGSALAQIPPRQVIVATLFGTTRTAGGAAAQQIPPGDVAMTISVDSVHGVAGLIEPGDEVDILVQLANGSKETSLYQNVPVLATGTILANAQAPQQGASSTAQSSSSGSGSGLITFAVPLGAAEHIALAESGSGTDGSLYLALVPPGNSAKPAPVISPQNLIPATLIPK